MLTPLSLTALDQLQQPVTRRKSDEKDRFKTSGYINAYPCCSNVSLNNCCIIPLWPESTNVGNVLLSIYNTWNHFIELSTIQQTSHLHEFDTVSADMKTLTYQLASLHKKRDTIPRVQHKFLSSVVSGTWSVASFGLLLPFASCYFMDKQIIKKPVAEKIFHHKNSDRIFWSFVCG